MTAAALEEDHPVGEPDRRQAVGHDDQRGVELARAGRAGCSASTVGSTDDVASSRIRTRGARASARASATRWRWPPESVCPRSPTTVS